MEFVDAEGVGDEELVDGVVVEGVALELSLSEDVFSLSAG